MDDERIARLEATVTQWMKGTDEFRQDQKDQFNTVRSDIKAVGVKVDGLPCPARVEATKGIKFQLTLFWWIIAFIVTSIGGLTFNALHVSAAWGKLNEKVDRHEFMIDKLDAYHRTSGVFNGDSTTARPKSSMGV